MVSYKARRFTKTTRPIDSLEKIGQRNRRKSLKKLQILLLRLLLKLLPRARMPTKHKFLQKKLRKKCSWKTNKKVKFFSQDYILMIMKSSDQFLKLFRKFQKQTFTFRIPLFQSSDLKT